MIKKRVQKKFEPHEHLEHWVTKTSVEDRLRWLEEANQFVRWVVQARKVVKKADAAQKIRRTKNPVSST